MRQGRGHMKTKNTIWTYNFTTLFITNCVAFFGQNMMSTLLPKYLNTLSISGTVIGIVVSMFSVTALCSRPITGPLIDGWKKKSLYLIMLGVMLASFLGYAVVGSSVVLLCAVRLLHGIGLGCLAALALTMATDSLPEDKIASGIGVYGLSSVLAMALGPGIGLAIVERWSYKATFLAAAALQAMSIVIASRMKVENRANAKIRFNLRSIISREAAMPAFLMLLSCTARACMTTFLVVVITDVRQIEGMSTYYILNALAMMVSRPLFGKISDKYGLHISLIPSYICFAASLLLTAVCQTTWQLWLVAILYGFGFGTASPSLQAMCMKLVEPERRGVASTTAFVGTDIGDLIGPIICGALVDAWGYGPMFALCVIPIVISVIILYPWVRRHRDQIVPKR